jgi:isoleucyl-tRNA synthetase
MSKRLDNTVDPFYTLNKYGADATRWYMVSNANPWDNLKFSWSKPDQEKGEDFEEHSTGIEEVQRKFFGTLYNTYSFFSLYANIDNFVCSEDDIALKERPEIDRWILSALHSLIQKVDDYYADYEPTKATRAISDFVQEHLSNWFVRLSRRRFWKGDYGHDKISAYQTLYTCLETVAKLAAPVAPFFMDRLYLDLNNATQKQGKESVHLTDFPTSASEIIDTALESKMEKAQTISSLTLSLRKKEMIKVRQPLQRIMIPVLNESQKNEIMAVADLIKSEVNVKEIELLDDASGILVKQIKPNFKALGPRFGKDMKAVSGAIMQFDQEKIAEMEQNGSIALDINGKNVKLTNEDVVISSQDIEGWLVANAGGLTVALDVNISKNLREEGIARELVNRIQNMRKDSGFDVTDKILVTLQKDGIIDRAVAANLEYIKTETLTQSLDLVADVNEGIAIEFDEVKTKLFIQKN